jgi:hypothetical protein
VRHIKKTAEGEWRLKAVGEELTRLRPCDAAGDSHLRDMRTREIAQTGIGDGYPEYLRAVELRRLGSGQDHRVIGSTVRKSWSCDIAATKTSQTSLQRRRRC